MSQPTYQINHSIKWLTYFLSAGNQCFLLYWTPMKQYQYSTFNEFTDQNILKGKCKAARCFKIQFTVALLACTFDLLNLNACYEKLAIPLKGWFHQLPATHTTRDSQNGCRTLEWRHLRVICGTSNKGFSSNMTDEQTALRLIHFR